MNTEAASCTSRGHAKSLHGLVVNNGVNNDNGTNVLCLHELHLGKSASTSAVASILTFHSVVPSYLSTSAKDAADVVQQVSFPAISGARLVNDVQQGITAVNNQQIPGRRAGYQLPWNTSLQWCSLRQLPGMFCLRQEQKEAKPGLESVDQTWANRTCWVPQEPGVAPHRFLFLRMPSGEGLPKGWVKNLLMRTLISFEHLRWCSLMENIEWESSEHRD
ncbi:uncharacterized protein LOC116792966 [Chiroxiphia lanceolata]|uniref:uncharacterized protein LOC116792966 n=1 Tax=Chiroxiphia lanceolata TaxID=296741 RepID=UPI0013CE4A6A|nr:uncharacterized protein LOC116792966 [Chiroxiphia lanceolata]